MANGDIWNVLFFYLSVVGLIWYCVLWTLGLLGCHAARKRYKINPRSPLSSAPKASVPGVSIIRPLRGLDTNLYENLESSFKQDYPNFEILMSVADEWDQAVPVAKDLIARYPDVHAKLIVGDETVGVNPKVNNLIRPYYQASNDIIWIIDSNVSVAPGTLARSVDALEGRIPPSVSSSKKRIGLVHHVPFASYSEARTGSRLEEAFLNTNHAKMYLAINTVAIESCVVGKSNMYRRSDVERVNGSLRPVPDSQERQLGKCGLAAFGQFLAEDNMIASALWHELDLRHELSCDVARNAVGNMSLSDYIWRRVRWIRVRKHMVLTATIAEPFTECVVLAVIAAACLRYLFGLSPWIFMVLHLPLWYLVDLDVYTSLAGHSLTADRRWSFALHWAARELLALPIFLLAIFGNEVEWRGRKYQVIKNGAVRVADKNGPIQIHHSRMMERA